jgi:hypothetical protein
MLTHADIQAIITRENLVVRNLQITQGYYRLSRGLRKAISQKNANWCTFATHASKTAGQALRHEMMPHLLKSAMVRLAGYDNTLIFFHDVLIDPEQGVTYEQRNVLAKLLKRVSLLVSEGNLRVFAELAGPFASLVEALSKDWVFSEDKLQAFLRENFRPGPIEIGGQDYLIEAFEAFYRARFETNSKRKAEQLLHANILVGLHEQIRLQPYIEQSLSVPLDMVFDRQPGRIFEHPDLQGMRWREAGIAKKLFTYVTTQMLMTISLPHRELKLSENVVAPTGIIRYPEELMMINDLRCLELVREYEARIDTLSGSAAGNWSSLLDRMSFIVDLFRSHQQSKRLFEAPFTEEQARLIEAGGIPAGPL